MINAYWLDHHGPNPGYLLLDAAGSPVLASPEALALLGPLSLREGGDQPVDLGNLIRRFAPGGDPPACPAQAAGPAFRILRTVPLAVLNQPEAPGWTLVLLQPLAVEPGFKPDEVQRAFGLSAREAEVLIHFVQGLNNRRIAEVMFVSEHTIRGHFKRIFKKMGAHSRTQLMARMV